MKRIHLFYFLLGLLNPMIGRAQAYGQVLITEIMADPSPPVGLPNAEYLELLNKGDFPVSLKGWKLTIGSSQHILPDTLLPARTYLILCHKNNLPLFAAYGRSCGLSSFNLPNDGALLALYTPQDKLMFSVAYLASWWVSGKRQGGYSLEIRDSHSPCLGRENWAASSHSLGGTPAGINSVSATVIDKEAPQLAYYGFADSRTVRMVFSERLDSLAVSQPIHFTLDGVSSLAVLLQRPEGTAVRVQLLHPVLQGGSHTFTVKNITDCAGNRMSEVKLPLGLPMVVDSGKVLLNEVLFNPRPDGVDYVELYNHSDKFVNLSNWKIGNVRSGVNENLKNLTTEPLMMPPFGFLVVSMDGLKVLQQYAYGAGRRFVDLAQFPAFPLLAGGVVLLNDQGRVMDRFLYTADMHDPLLSAVKGVALERIDPGKSSETLGNWQSASGNGGYGTPGYGNSQRFVGDAPGLVTVEPEGFSPNGDGVDDQAYINFNFASPGHFTSISVYNVQGHLVRNLATNLSVGSQNRLSWDGADNKGGMVVGGYYFIVAQVWNSTGYQRTFRKKVVVAR